MARSDNQHLWAYAFSVLLTLSCLTGLSCRGGKPAPRHGTPLDLCIEDAYKGTDRHRADPPPEVVAAARECIAKYVKAPQFDWWARRLPKTVDSAKLEKADDVFMQHLVKCAAAHGMSIDSVMNEDGSRRIEARSASSPEGVRSTEPAFRDCARAGEDAERTFLAQGAQSRP